MYLARHRGILFVLYRVVKYIVKSRIKITSLLLALFICILPGFGNTWAAYSVITGQVTDTKGDPVMGASTVLYNGGSIVTGIATDITGNFILGINAQFFDSLVLKTSAIGYRTEERSFELDNDTTRIEITLVPQAIEVRSIRVSPDPKRHAPEVLWNVESLQRASQKSLVPTNPVSAIQQPQAIREGSSHSSKLWVNGTSPKYYINDIEIGTNPNHFGMFSIIPGTVVNTLRFHDQGTAARFGLPAAVTLETGSPFHRHATGEINLSVVEATGTWSLGTDRYYMLGSLRKSILDKLVQQFSENNISSDRRTIPPTNFQDLFLSSGIKFSNTYRLTVDQYHVRDYLLYHAKPTSNNEYAIDTYLHTAEHYIGTRFDAVYRRFLVKLTGAIRTDSEQYRTLPILSAQNTGVHLDLKTRRQVGSGSIEIGCPLGKSFLKFGNQTEYTLRHQVTMTQRNWNFLPPDANSDNPYIYQPELNQLYGSYSGDFTQTNNSTYSSLDFSIRKIEFESSLRLERFGRLSHNTALLLRQRITIPTGEKSNLSLYYGTFAENPVYKIYEPYQVLVHANLDRLNLISSKLVSAGYSYGALKVGLFGKAIDNLPVVTPNFASIREDGTAAPGFITMQSTGSAHFYGGDIAVELNDLNNGRFDIYSFYGHTISTKQTKGISVPHQMNAPHRFFARAAYQLSKVVNIGTDLAVRSGYAYTPSLASEFFIDPNRYSEEYYRDALSKENSVRFPMHASLNLHVSFDFGSTELFMSTSNVTNRANPIINTADGYIYDAGILPSVGFVWKF